MLISRMVRTVVFKVSVSYISPPMSCEQMQGAVMKGVFWYVRVCVDLPRRVTCICFLVSLSGGTHLLALHILHVDLQAAISARHGCAFANRPSRCSSLRRNTSVLAS